MRDALALMAALAALPASCLPWKHGAAPPAPATVQATTSAPSAPQVLPPPREDGRLPQTATPRRYAISLRIDPAQPRFSGVSAIDVDLPAPTSFVVMHGRALTVTRALARLVGGAEIAATASVRMANRGVVPDELVLSFARPLPAGSATLEIDYEAAFSDDLAGLYRVSEAGRSYVYSQFEAVDARRAFPCFDEPGYKTPFDLTVTAPAGMTALTNTPEVSRADAPAGAITHTFRTSPPLPTYLVAFAVGDFDILQGQKDPFPIRVVTTKGRSDLAGMALDVATALVAKLGEYFDLRYPYAKLDLVAVPDFAAGAMENPGLITFRHGLLLLDPRRATAGARRTQAEVIAHELAHQWFGDLVTIKWWDDLWLNEGFATWAEGKIVDSWKPSFGATLGQVAGTQWVMDTDALHSARAVRQTVTSTGEAMEAFDGITYDKGAAVLRMLEDWLSPEMFRRGIQHYVRENAWKNARAADLFKALEFVSTQDVSKLAGDFLDHAGVPEVLLAWTCGRGNKIELRQSEWRPIGGGGDPPRTWTLPVCVTSDALKARSCFTLGSTPIVRDLGPTCPTWVYPNAGQTGYYRFVVDRPGLMALARASRSFATIDRLGLVSNAWAGVRQAAIAPSALLDVLPTFDGESERHVVDQVVTALRGVDEMLVEDGTRAAFEKYVAARLSQKKRALGWETAATTGREIDDDDRALLRRTVLLAMGEVAGDEGTLEEADVFAKRWLEDPTSVPSDTAAVAVPLASKVAGLARLTELRAAAKSAKLPEERVLALRAMGAFDDPAILRKALDVTLTDELKLSEIGYVIGSANRRATRAVLYAWEKENWDKLRAKVPGNFRRGLLVDVAGGLCDKAAIEDAKAFFTTATQGLEGIRRPLEESIERSQRCEALRDHDASDVTDYFRHGGYRGQN